MSIGYSTILKLRRIEDDCIRMGLTITHPKTGWAHGGGDILAVVPAGNALPIYSRDAELFVGTLDELSIWMKGTQWMHNYYEMIGLLNAPKIQKKEDEVRRDHLVSKLKNEKIALKETK